MSDEVERFVNSLPWREVRVGGGVEWHQYVIAHWPEVDTEQFWQTVAHIREHGYRGRYTPSYSGKTMTFRYLELGEFVYWAVPPQLCRTRIEYGQHERIEEPQRLWEET